MTAKKLPTVTVELEDGTTLGPLNTDNRDAVRWDLHRCRQNWPATADAPMLWLTFLAWSAAKRLGQTTLTFDAWNDAAVNVQVEGQDDDLDPTQPAAASDT